MQEYFNNYIINIDGSVISKLSGKTLKPENCKLGYQRITLCHKGKPKRFLLHRLIALNHIPNPNHLPCINHKDGDKKNNHVDNLEWCSYSYNEIYSYKKLNKKASHGIEHYNSKLNEELVREIRNTPNPKVCTLAKKYGVHHQTISDVLSFKNWKHVI